VSEKIRILIVDDERLAREELRYLLKPFNGIEITGEAKNAKEAKEMIRELNPDLLLLDINLPGKNAFEMLQELSEIPKVIFVTAYDRYAVRAFEENALDYIVKPTRPERLAKALEKVHREILKESGSLTLLNKQIFLKDGEKCFFVKIGDISIIESAGNYSKFSFNNQSCTVHRSLKQIEEELPASIFFRANRQQIINLNFITHVTSGYKGGMSVTLKNDLEIEISNRNAVLFKQLRGV
jgi:two-component system LytT family response regulator